MTEYLNILNSTALGPIAAFVFGLIWGSFFNVCIFRLPQDLSVVSKRSFCPHCKNTIPWFCNLPVFSFLFLLGKCRFCKKSISIEYPLVELVTALLFLALWYRFGWSLHFLVYAIFTGALVVVSVIDLHHRIIPDEVSLPGIVVGFLATWLVGDLAWWESLLGILMGGGIFFLVAYLYERFTGREGLGGGDVKLLGFLGAWLGYKSILIIIILSTSLGSILGILLIAFRGKDMKTGIPFGPFLAVAGLVYLFFNEFLLSWFFPVY